jgi:cellobiose-specific phosphotransferase system component IIC
MEILIIIIIIIVAVCSLWWFMILRGQKAVRAFVFLCDIENGKTELEANISSSRIDIFAATKIMDNMISSVDLVYGGSQLTMISEARRLGYNQ